MACRPSLIDPSKTTSSSEPEKPAFESISARRLPELGRTVTVTNSLFRLSALKIEHWLVLSISNPDKIISVSTVIPSVYVPSGYSLRTTETKANQRISKVPYTILQSNCVWYQLMLNLLAVIATTPTFWFLIY